jgi:uncharacterized RDD family membrane protein YckC
MICRNHVDVEEGVTPCTRCGEAFCADCVVVIHGQPYCATCKSEKLLDVQSGTDRGQLPLAAVGRRLAALVIDRLMFAALFIALVLVATLFEKREATETFFVVLFAGMGLVYVGFIVYEGLMLSARGQTLGKMALKIRVVRPDGTAITTGQAWGRTVLRGVMIYVLSLLNYIPALVTKEKTCIHDLVANTRVISID